MNAAVTALRAGSGRCSTIDVDSFHDALYDGRGGALCGTAGRRRGCPYLPRALRSNLACRSDRRDERVDLPEFDPVEHSGPPRS